MMVQAAGSAVGIKQPLPTSLPIPTVIESPAPSATPTNADKTQQNSQNSQTAQPSVTHNGSRTGRIVEYTSYCEHKTIKVYENELMYLTANDGKQTYSTKGDLDCYNKDINQKTQGNNTNTPQDSHTNSDLVACPDGWGHTITESKDACDQYLKTIPQQLDNINKAHPMPIYTPPPPKYLTPQVDTAIPNNTYTVPTAAPAQIPPCPISASGQVIRDISGGCSSGVSGF